MKKTRPIYIWIGLTMSVLVALILPVGFFTVSYTYLTGELETEADVNAGIISEVIGANPELWRYEQMRLQELLSQRSRSGHPETRRILDKNRVVIAESVNALSPPVVTNKFDILDAGVPVGTVEISRSLLPTLLVTGIIAICGLFLGATIFYLLWKLAFRDIFLAEQQRLEFIEKIMESGSQAVMVLDLGGLIIRGNAQSLEISGLSGEEIAGRKFISLFDVNDAPSVENHMSEVTSAKVHMAKFPAIMVRKDGNCLYVACGISPLVLEGKVINMLVSIEDISERLKAQEDLRLYAEELSREIKERQRVEETLRLNEEMLRVQIDEYVISQKLLKDSEERFRALNDASFGGIMIHDNGLILDCNQGLSDMTGFTIEELTGMDSLKLIDPDWLELVAQHIQNSFDQRYEVWGLRKDGTKYPLAIRGKNIPYQGRIARVKEFRDLTEIKILEQQFHQAQKLESLGVLAGGIAHDFNNILTVIMGHCYMARENFIPEQEYIATFKQIETAGNRATDLCRQMLTYAGKSLLVQTRVNLWLLVDEVVKMLQSAIKKNVTIELDLKRDVPEIRGDTGQIQQIIMNLIINAAEAIGDDNGTVKVVLTKTVFEAGQTATDTFGTVIKAGKYTCLEVTDNGCGMNEETQKKIFEPFFTTKFTGRGLGMSAIRGIIKSHEGILSLTSKQGVGSTFKVYFPVPEASDYLETDSIESAPSINAGGTILLVEDEVALRVLGKALLETMGFSAMTAQNGREALELHREQSGGIDVILLDLIMPVMGGIEAYNELRKVDATIPIIICSGYGVESVEHFIKNDEHAGFVHKPYKPDELRNVIIKMMRYEVGS